MFMGCFGYNEPNKPASIPYIQIGFSINWDTPIV